MAEVSLGHKIETHVQKQILILNYFIDHFRSTVTEHIIVGETRDFL